MALISPGVQVTIVDESNYIPAATNSVPYILLATAQNKVSGTGPGVAAGTLAVNAGRVYLITSQRDLAATFGNPFFYKTAAGTPINGYELNEYGLLAANSVLGISNRAYIQRADIDLSELTATLVRPTGAPTAGTYWLDTAATSWGIFQWNLTTAAFTVQSVLPLTSSDQLSGGIPLSSIGSIGDYCVDTTNLNLPVYFKNTANNWVEVGGDDWKKSWPTIQGTESVTGSALTPGNIIIINGNTITVPGAGTLASLVSTINSTLIPGVTAEVDSSNRFVILANGEAESDGSTADGGVVNIAPESTAGLLTTLGVASGTYYAPGLQQSPNYTVPRWRSSDDQPHPTGSVWNLTNNVNGGANIVVKKYDAALGAFVQQANPLFQDEAAAIYALDPVGGGRNIPIGTLWTQYNYDPEISVSVVNNTATFKILERWAVGRTVVTAESVPSFGAGTKTFTLQASEPGSGVFTSAVTISFAGTTAESFVTAVSAAGVENVSAELTSDGYLAFIHATGGAILVQNTVGAPIGQAGFNNTVQGCRSTYGGLMLSNFQILDYTATSIAPTQNPANGRYWYYSATNQVDIMIQNNGAWVGYQTVSNDVRGYDLTATDPAGPIISTTAPTQQSDGTQLVYGDLWVNTSNLEAYPVLNRWEVVNGVNQWVTLDNTNQTTSNGILFEDARWATNGTTNPITDPLPTIVALLTSSYLDLDAPDATLYPQGMLLWNTRRSGFNVKTFRTDYFNGTDFSIGQWSSSVSYAVNDIVLYNGTAYISIQAGSNQNPSTATAYWSLLETNAWVTASGNRNNGSPYMGRKAVRQIVVAALKSAIDTQDTLREEQQEFNLVACPQYPELIPNMVALNNERNNTAFVVGDTPLRLGPQGTSIVDWATDGAGLGIDSEDGLVTSDPYLAVFYPQCQTTDLGGSQVVQPASHMMLRTIVRSDEVAYPWLAPAGVRRGVIDNAERIGYINSTTGEFVTIATGQGVRDVLYTNKINPITFIPGVGITNYGNKTEASTPSALDRINVARLVSFIRGRLNEIGKTFVFEPNDQITRNEITNAINNLMIDLIAKRGIYDYLIVCDESNNTPARIDRNELYVDIAIEPVKAVEFIYIPVRIKNTGEIAAGITSPSSAI